MAAKEQSARGDRILCYVLLDANPHLSFTHEFLDNVRRDL